MASVLTFTLKDARRVLITLFTDNNKPPFYRHTITWIRTVTSVKCFWKGLFCCTVAVLLRLTCSYKRTGNFTHNAQNSKGSKEKGLWRGREEGVVPRRFFPSPPPPPLYFFSFSSPFLFFFSQSVFLCANCRVLAAPVDTLGLQKYLKVINSDTIKKVTEKGCVFFSTKCHRFMS